MSNFKYRKNIFYVENLSIKNLVKNYGTPFYCYSLNSIVEKFKEFNKPFINQNITICYAVKANPNIAILKILSQLGCGVEVVSKGELERAFKAKISNKKIVFSGVGKTSEEIEYAIKKNILQINVESVEEIRLISKLANKVKKKVGVSIRINPNIDAGTHKKITTGKSENKFGLDTKDAELLFKNYKNDPNVNIQGISIHIGSQITNMNPFIRSFKKLNDFVKKINKNGHSIKYLDLGGGIGIPYKKEKVINHKHYSENVLKISKEFNCNIILEPGRVLIAESGILISKVIYIKKNKNNNFVILDTGMNDLIRPALYESHHEVLPATKNKYARNMYTIVGPICESADTFIKKTYLNKIKINDILFFKNTGAYGASMSSNYNSRPIIPEIMVYQNQSTIIRNRELVSKQISKEKIPKYIKKIKY